MTQPDKKYPRNFNVRVDPELLRDVRIVALKNGESLRWAVTRAYELLAERYG